MDNIVLSRKVSQALSQNKPVLALESSILSQGMPYPDNYTFAKKAENLCSVAKVTPATIAILDGVVFVGLSEKQLKFVCEEKNIKKVSRREIGLAIAKRWNCSTTVSSTIHIAHSCGIKVFSTGGIGGVHRNQSSSFDISQDIRALSETPLVVITAGPKAILNINKTVEHLETHGITSVGYKTEEYPSFFSSTSGVFGLERVNSVDEIVELYRANIASNLFSSVLVSNPLPKKDEIPFDTINTLIQDSCIKAKNKRIKGKDLTPFLLKEIVKLTSGKSLEVNVRLALNNIELAIKILKNLFD